jgi:hypothetical protein
MGIRFYCEACEKRLNVKGFLAGKRGVCPHCGAKVDIPWESQSKPAGAAAAAMPAPRSASVTPLPTIARETQPALAAGPINGHSYGAPVSVSPAMVQPVQPIAVVQPLPTVQPVAVSAVPMAAPVMAAAVVAPALPTPAAPADPITEAPNAVWYVRPPSGGQYGPASGEIMRKWITEGRVSADSLIWREGWADWKSAASQFPEMAGPNAPRAGAASFPAQPSFSSPIEAPASRPIVRKKNNTTLAIVVVVVLTLASLGLLVGLVLAIQFGAG